MINLYKAYKEKRNRFPGQNKNERIVFVIRKHKIILLFYGFYVLVMALIPIMFYIFVVPEVFPAFFEYPYDRLLTLLLLIYYGFVWIAIFTIWVDYYFDMWIVTDQRILDIEQRGFFSRAVSELDLRRIQDITSEVNGIVATMFRFGNIHIQTAGERVKFDLMFIPHPVTVRRKIIELYMLAREKEGRSFINRNE